MLMIIVRQQRLKISRSALADLNATFARLKVPLSGMLSFIRDATRLRPTVPDEGPVREVGVGCRVEYQVQFPHPWHP